MKTGTQDCEYLKWQTCPLVECECMPLKYVDDADIPSVTVTTEKGASFNGGNTYRFNFDYIDHNVTADDTPTLWRDMTPEEKGALLLAQHEKPGSVEFWSVNEWVVLKNFGWHDKRAYRIKPQPKVETVTLYWCNGNSAYIAKKYADTHRITLTIRDGKPDPVAQVEPL